MSVPFDFAGIWRSTYLGYGIEVRVSQDKDILWAVVVVTDLFGDQNTYHVHGKVDGTNVFAWHHNGRSFRGRATSQDRGEGVLTAKSGAQLRLRGVRVSRGQAAGDPFP